jgi:tetratricopeptide (TPR) repeat protein
MTGFLKAIVVIFVFALVSADLIGQSMSCPQAGKLFRQRQWTEAATAFEECEKSDPGKTDALLYRGKSLINVGQFEAASAALQSYRNTHSSSDEVGYLLAYVRFRENKPAESLQLFTDAGKLRPPTADDLKIVALDYVLLSDYEDAGHYLELALRLDPESLEARYHLGRVRYQQNRFDFAIAAFQEVLKRDAANVKAQDNLALCLDAENKTDLAIAAYQKAIQLDSTATVHNEGPYLNLGALFSKSNRSEEAIPLLLRASEITPKQGRPHYELGKAYFNLNRFEDSRREAVQATSLDPGDQASHYLLGRIYQRLGKADLAAEQFKKTESMIHDSEGKPGSGMQSGMSPH